MDTRVRSLCYGVNLEGARLLSFKADASAAGSSWSKPLRFCDEGSSPDQTAPTSVSRGTLNSNNAPDGAFGILAVLSALALIVDLGIERLSPGTAIPNIGGSRTQTRFVLACVTALFVALKFVFNIHFSDFGFGFYAAVVLTIGLVWVAFQTRSGTSVVGNIHVGR